MVKKLSEQLAELLQESGNYSEIARRAGLDPSQVARIAKGERTGRKETLDQIGQAMGLVIGRELEASGVMAARPGEVELRLRGVRDFLSQCREEVAEARKELARASGRLDGLERVLDRLERQIG